MEEKEAITTGKSSMTMVTFPCHYMLWSVMNYVAVGDSPFDDVTKFEMR